MTQKSITDVFLSETCLTCQGEGYVTIGRYDEEEIVECICRKEARAEKEADGLEDANIVGE